MCSTATVAAGWVDLPGAAQSTARPLGSLGAAGLRVVVMGVSGSGKSTLAAQLATALGAEFVEGDELHPPSNVERMAAGIALTDEDRLGWLQAIAARLSLARESGRSIVVSCSALKRSYRDLLRHGAADARFIHLHGSAELLSQRLAQRAGHYMPPSLLPSQLITLQAPGIDEGALTLDIAQPIETLLQTALNALTPTPVTTPRTAPNP